MHDDCRRSPLVAALFHSIRNTAIRPPSEIRHRQSFSLRAASVTEHVLEAMSASSGVGVRTYSLSVKFSAIQTAWSDRTKSLHGRDQDIRRRGRCPHFDLPGQGEKDALRRRASRFRRGDDAAAAADVCSRQRDVTLSVEFHRDVNSLQQITQV